MIESLPWISEATIFVFEINFGRQSQLFFSCPVQRKFGHFVTTKSLTLAGGSV
jgi:hypothetical protein